MTEPDCWARVRKAAIDLLESEEEQAFGSYASGRIDVTVLRRHLQAIKSRRQVVINDPNYLAPRPTRRMPSAVNVARYWAGRGTPFEVFIDEPQCFSCGLESDNWRNFDRAHLEDRFLGGLDNAANLVMLCQPCHRIMPMFEPGTYHQSIKWVMSQPRLNLSLQIMDRMFGPGQDDEQ